MIPYNVVSLLDQLQVDGAILGKTACIVGFIFLAFADFQVSPLLLKLFL